MCADTTWEPADPKPLNQRAVLGLVGSVMLGVAGFFALDLIRTVSGLGFLSGFGVVLVIELVAIVGVVLSTFRLHDD
ncbi:MAG: hypothetical protein RI544_07160 [Haloquadratum sp.]|nr:hypothetical protein [Haloquadratum sp.]